MYVYNIFEVAGEELKKIDFVCGTGDETTKEMQAIAEARLAELRATLPPGKTLKMTRRILPGI